jgi:hypothetical protein
MAPKISKINKQAATGTITNITFPIPETLEIIIKPGFAISQRVIMAAYKIALMTKRSARKKLPARTWVSIGTV